MKRDYYTTPESSAIMRFFWRAAGGDKYILERATYSDQIKYMCLGGIVVATGVMAGIAGGYAIYTIFQPKGSALESEVSLSVTAFSIAFGIIWGLIIFNIDRFIVTSTGKGDGTEAITWDELKSAFPRMVMGAIIALTISKPVEIRMFKSEIDAELHSKQMEQQAEYKTRIEGNFQGFIDSSRVRVSNLKGEIAHVQKQYDDLSVEYSKEIQGKVGSGKAGDGPAARSILLNMNRKEKELADLTNKVTPMIESENAKIHEWEAKINSELSKGEMVAASLDGLLERIKIAHEIAGFWISLFITLLFMVIELTPIFFKLMLTKTPYDYMEDNIKELMKAEQGIYIQYNYYKDKEGQERDLVRHLQVEKVIANKLAEHDELLKVQERLTQYAISKYETEMMKKIDANPEKFILVQSPVTADAI